MRRGSSNGRDRKSLGVWYYAKRRGSDTDAQLRLGLQPFCSMCVGLAAAHMITQITWFPRFALQAYPLHDKEGATEAERKDGKKAWNKRIFFFT
jgi:hypothetical protein